MKLPIPDHDALIHSKKLLNHIRQTIEKAGDYISFARFMELALYAPGLGYYSAGSYKFGKQGDFVTAPEISPLFAQCIAKQCQQVFLKLQDRDFLEIGAGAGVFAKDLLLELERLDSLPNHYFILEVSAELKERQQQLLQTHCPHLLARIQWLDSLPTKKITGIIFANEVMDAMPVNCFRIEDHVLKERCVTWENNQFAWCLTAPTNPDLVKHTSHFLEFAGIYESEICLSLPAWINTLSLILNEGLVLLSDYGYGREEYYHRDRSHGTLRCFYQHHFHDDPFFAVGLQDITAHVDFTTVVESAIDAGLALAGYTTQAGFLLACGLLELAERNSQLSLNENYQQSQSIKTLTLPSEMGELIKIMGLSKGLDMPLLGFSLLDRRREL